ncbi:MAG: hypothetical protein FGF48_00430 [Candidatus Brockarchaeota archaeon]|nr:hypothetical protein [Candidatus Brockarchaeota archaeon]
MLPVDVPVILFSTTQSITLFWAMDKATRIVLNRIKTKNYAFSVRGLRIHHWLIGAIVAALGLLVFSAQNLVMLIYETSLASIPWKLGSSTVTVGFRIFIDDLKDLKRQFKSLIRMVKR